MQPPPLYAHRLGAAYGPDSSARALGRALAGPLGGLETDCCLTADGQLVLLHDPLLSLGTTLTGWAHERRAAEICSARLLDRRGRPTAERPLLLGELLERVPPGLPLQLEVKSIGDAALARRTAIALCNHLGQRADRERVEVISFWSVACAAAATAGFRARLVLFAEYDPAGLGDWARDRGVRGVSVEHFLLSPPLVGVLREAGLSVTTGTVNDPELLERVAALGVDAVCSDRPHELAAALRARGTGLAAAA